MNELGIRPETLLGTSARAFVVLRMDLVADVEAPEELVYAAGVYRDERDAAAATDRLNRQAIGKARYFYRATRLDRAE